MTVNNFAHLVDELLILEQKDPNSGTIPQKRMHLIRTYGKTLASLTDPIEALRTCIHDIDQTEKKIATKYKQRIHDREYHLLHVTLADLKEAKANLLTSINDSISKDGSCMS